MLQDLPDRNITPPTTPDPGDDSYPINKLESNDGSTVRNKPLTDPYTPYGPNIDPGMLLDTDKPSFPYVFNYSPQLGSEIEFRAQYREFCRLEIGKKWYVISGYLEWRFHSKLKKTWIENEDDINRNGIPDGFPDGSEGQMRNNGSESVLGNEYWSEDPYNTD